jgi:HSP20 family protein
MSLIPWKGKRESPATADEPMTLFRDEMDSLFDRFFRDPWGGVFERFPPARAFGGGLRLDVSETEEEVTVTAEVPGVEPKDLEISVTGNVLTIQGEKRAGREEKKRNFHMIERQYGSFTRSVQLPGYVDSSNVDASFRNGVLTVKLPKRPEAKAKRIEVKRA